MQYTYPILFVIFLVLLLPSSFAQCSRHAHCDTTIHTGFCFSENCIRLSRRQSPANNVLNPASEQTQTFPLSYNSFVALVNSQSLSRNDREIILNVSANVLENLNPHRYVHLNLFKSDPAARLRNLAKNDQTYSLSPIDFHEKVREVFASVRDFHTVYKKPGLLRSTIATLGFSVQYYYKSPDKLPEYIVSDVSSIISSSSPTFTTGLTLIAIDGVPIRNLVKRLGNAGYGSTPGARLNRGIAALSVRVSSLDPLPQRPSAVVTYSLQNGTICKATFPWLFIPITDILLGGYLNLDPMGSSSMSRATVPVSDLLKSSRLSTVVIPVAPEFAVLMASSIVTTKSGKMGVLRLRAFIPPSPPLIDELKRILRLLPQDKLLIDIRGNMGGHGALAKALAELVGDVNVPPLSSQLLVTPLVGALVSKDSSALPQGKAFRQIFRRPYIDAATIKEPFTGPAGDLFTFGIEFVPPVQQRIYFGKISVVTDGATFSAAEIFTSIQKDISSSLIVGIDGSTGGGGAATVRYNDVLRMVFPTVFDESLPVGVDFRTAFAKFFRLGRSAGERIEARGISPHIRYFKTKDDVLNNDAQLFEFVAEKLTM